jgi:hypothetical protein
MTTQEIYKLANELTSQDISNVISGWEITGSKSKLNSFNNLVLLGDSESLAMATVLGTHKKDGGEFYQIAYYS